VHSPAELTALMGLPVRAARDGEPPVSDSLAPAAVTVVVMPAAAVTVVVMPAVAVAVPIHGLCSHCFFPPR
jgi:hypothetical protein